jgi:hypothetical protein
MRSESEVTKSGFQARAFAGTNAVLFALNCPKESRDGLMGFAFERQLVGSGLPAKFLRSQKVFKSVIPDPKTSRQRPFYTDSFPVQSFLWGDYAVAPGRKYKFRILPMFGSPAALTTDPQDEITLEIETEKEWSEGETHGIWVNRGAIASQKFAEEFGNKPPQHINDPKDPTVAWLSRGLLEACLAFIEQTPP